MKNKLSILVLILSFFVSSCSKTVESKNQPESDSIVKQASLASESKVYQITWSYCGGPEKILSAKEDGCVRSSRPLYFWLEEPGVSPKGILIKRGLALSSSYAKYQVAILAQGCFPKSTKILPLDFYSVRRQFSVNTKVVGERKVLEDLVLDVKPLTREEANKILVYYTVRPNLLPPGCDSLEAEREKLAPYSSVQLGTISN